MQTDKGALSLGGNIAQVFTLFLNIFSVSF